MKIENAEILSSDRKKKIRGGVYIEYTSKDNVVTGSNLEMVYEDKKHYFEVVDVSISGKDLAIKAKEVGYFANNFHQKPDFDIRTLVGKSLRKVEDKDTIAKIHEMNLWC